MSDPRDTPELPKEAQLMAALDTIVRKAEEAMSTIQDDSRLTGLEDRNNILLCIYVIEAKAEEIRGILKPEDQTA